MKKLLIWFAALAVLGTSTFAADQESVRKAPELAFSIPGQGQKLLSQYRGKVVALEFIYTTCPHCQAASRVMSKLQQEYGPRGFQVLDVAVNPNADLLVENFAKDFQVNFPVGWTSADQMTSFMGFANGRFVVPQLALIDRQGNIHYQTPATEDENWDKLMKEDAIRAHIEQLLAIGNASTHPRSASARAAAAKRGS
ncbi:MAG: TlpA family protein disulfide reductase [Acidobacteriaceae bacterium]|nr:TlpA family protein disulfide reductase [Acidobacteriaceae bacterium]